MFKKKNRDPDRVFLQWEVFPHQSSILTSIINLLLFLTITSVASELPTRIRQSSDDFCLVLPIDTYTQHTYKQTHTQQVQIASRSVHVIVVVVFGSQE